MSCMVVARPVFAGVPTIAAGASPNSTRTLGDATGSGRSLTPVTSRTRTRGRRRWLTCIVAASLAMGAGALADVPGDADLDGDVDASDFAQLATCLSGPGNSIGADCHEFFDLDFDFDVDLPDLAAFQCCFSGQGQPGDPSCAPHLARIENGCLHIIGTAANTTLALRLRVGIPSILDVDVDNDGWIDFSFDRGLFTCIVVDARGGSDVVWIDEANGMFTDAELTTVKGGRGSDTLIGGSGGETYVGGPGNDTVFLGAGSDRFIWNPGDDTDVIDGGPGSDTVEVNGSDASESFTITANGALVRFDRLSPTPFFLDIGACESLVLRANGGNDSLACTGNLAALIQITADGGPGNDTLLGSNGPDVLIGGDDDDVVDGNQGADLVFLGAGDDVFQWDPGDGNDTVEGQTGHDIVRFNGSSAAELYDFSANGSRLRFTRNIGNVILDAAGIEQFDLRALGGADIATINELGGTGLTQVNVNLAGTLGGSTGDGADDSVVIAGTVGADTFNISADGDFVVIELAAEVRVRGYELMDQVVVNGVGGDTVIVNGSDGPDTMTLTASGTQGRVDVTGYSAAVAVSGALSLTLNGLGGPDSMSCTGNLAGLLIPFTFDGGPGDDTLLGSNGPDVLIGGDDDDVVDGNQGADLVFLGAGNDIFQWDPGDGNDTVEGQTGHDIVRFNGSSAAELYEFSANGSRLRFTRNIGNVVLDAAGIEQFDLRALGGADTATINDLSGTGVAEVNVNLAGTLGGNTGDGAADLVTVNGTSLPDTIHVGVSSGAVGVTGLAAFIRITNSEVANDTLDVNGLGGVDTITFDPAVLALIMLTINQ